MATARQAAFRARQTAENIAARQAASAPTPASAQPPSNSMGTGNRTVGSVMLKGIGVAPKGAA